MSRKEISPPYPIFSAALANQTMTGTATLISAVTNILFRDIVAIELSWTGTPAGTFQIQGSNSYNPGTPESGGAPNAGIWTTIPAVDQNGNSPVASGSAGQILCNLSTLGFAWIRTVYTNSTGSGTLTGYIAAKSSG